MGVMPRQLLRGYSVCACESNTESAKDHMHQRRGQGNTAEHDDVEPGFLERAHEGCTLSISFVALFFECNRTPEEKSRDEVPWGLQEVEQERERAMAESFRLRFD